MRHAPAGDSRLGSLSCGMHPAFIRVARAEPMHPETDFPPDLRALENDYSLIRELGRGGMAAVYLARRRDTGRLVTIKAIRARYLDDPREIRSAQA